MEPREVQNVYDDPVFFEGYKKVWSQPNPYNDGIERPALLSLLPPPDQWRHLKFLDLGCGTGKLSFPLAEGGATVRGVDVSQRMLAVARERLAAADGDLRARLSFAECALEHYADADETYDVVVAGLVLHYVRDVAPLLRAVRRWLRPGGALVFSTEHPICTSAQGLHPAYVVDDEHRPPQPQQDHPQEDRQQQPKQHKYYVYDRYHEEGERRATWFVDGVVRYHRTMASWVNGLVEAGFVVDRLLEPRPTADALAAFPDALGTFDQRRVIFLCVRALRPPAPPSPSTSSSTTTSV